MTTISRTYDALVSETHDAGTGEHTTRAGILADGRAFKFIYRYGAAALGIGDDLAEAAADPAIVTCTYGEPGRCHLEPAECRTVILDLLRAHPDGPPMPLEPGQLVTIHEGTRLWEVVRLDDLNEMARLARVDEEGDLEWVSVNLLRRVDRHATGTTSDGKTWRLDQLHDRVRLIVDATVIDSRSALGSEGAAGAFETLWGTFSHGCADARRSDTPTAGAA